MRSVKGERPQLDKLERFESGHRFQVGDIEVKPFTIPHDCLLYTSPRLPLASIETVTHMLASIRDSPVDWE